MAAFRGMHVSPAKHSYAWLSRKCDYRTDRHTHTHRQTPDKVIPMCRYASQATQQVISIYVHCDLDLWPPTSKINRVHPLTMCNMSAKFVKQIQNGLVSIVFTSLFPYMSIVTLTFDLWPQKSIGFILSSWLTCLPSLINKYKTV